MNGTFIAPEGICSEQDQKSKTIHDSTQYITRHKPQTNTPKSNIEGHQQKFNKVAN